MLSSFSKTCLLLIAAAFIASGAPTTFAQFSQTSSTSPFVFTNLGFGSVLSFDGSTTAEFCFLVPTSAGACDIPATVAFIAFTDDPVVTVGSLLIQPVDYGSFEFRRVSDSALLLGALFVNGFLSGATGANGASLSFTTAGTGSVAYSSDFLSFSALSNNDFGFGFSGLTPPLSIAGNGQLDNFEADAAGTFSTDGIVPEPGTYAMFGSGIGLILLAIRRRTN